MIESSPAHESFLILVFVCAPLLLLLIAALVLSIRLTPLTTMEFPTFSLTISTVGHGEAFVIYRNESKKLYLEARISRGSTFYKSRIVVSAPGDLSGEDLRDAVPKLAEGLTKLRYEYLIFRKGNPQPIPGGERQEAIAELRQMGFDIQEPVGAEQILRAVTHSWKRTSGERAKARISQVQRLMATASGVRENIEVLACSD
jgi:hypothetical protein